ncbi:DUF896 domain-containing protein [Clostridium swellfunianum]|uniref:DUF896 domain-containing protein n=1 Tax=Clostridium swellfunianum TaxID=1367462 RepID=UPI00202E3F46|nr:DUF896 domain-containing protein [Clostridium swellfunianum]MCM0648478.1 DUF896 domain-containing protein [Clostridium swellfunianum]
MNIEEVIKRINYLYKKSQEVGLTEEEKLEQKELRQRYIDNVKRNFRQQLETIEMKGNNNGSNNRKFN